MRINTNALNRAAFLFMFGGKLIHIDGHVPDCSFTIETNRFVLWYEKAIGFVPYRAFCESRRILKRKARIHSGLPTNYMDSTNGDFTFLDVAKVGKLGHKEKNK